MKTLVLGMGNTILADDGVGIYVAREVKSQLRRPNTDVVETELAGFHLVDLLAGYDRAIIVDSIRTKGGRPGEVHRLTPECLDRSSSAASPHHLDLRSALELGQKLSVELPTEILIFAVEVKDTETFSDRCTTLEVEKAIPLTAQRVLEELT